MDSEKPQNSPSLSDCTTEIFDLVQQWILTGFIILDDQKLPKHEKIMLCLEFLVYADYIDLLGPFDSVISSIKQVLLT